MKSKTSRLVVFVFAALVLILIAGCAAGDATKWNAASPAGFWAGLWHGMISIVTFIISLFNQNVEVYERINNGGWYDFGFLLGILLIWGGTGGVGIRLRKCQAERRRLYRLLERKINEERDIDEKVEKKMRETLKKWFEE